MKKHIPQLPGESFIVQADSKVKLPPICEPKDWEEVFRSMNSNTISYKKMLEKAGFSLNNYPEGYFWEFVVTDDEKKKRKIARIFGSEFDDYVDYTDIDTLILQCKKNYSNCLFYYDCNSWDMETEDFMNCIQRYINEEECEKRSF